MTTPQTPPASPRLLGQGGVSTLIPGSPGERAAAFLAADRKVTLSWNFAQALLILIEAHATSDDPALRDAAAKAESRLRAEMANDD
ncbi:hypothetical protein ACH4PU_30330 [Streptomyces sp. NPDC021100]|uniref:hypothetical protein n=1 Tax=Streptomyces sp. NPDC021100 TaxID=3365114 RepID=UPI0037BBDA43